MKQNVDINKFIYSLKTKTPDEYLKEINKALEEQGFRYENGKIKQISPRYKSGDCIIFKENKNILFVTEVNNHYYTLETLEGIICNFDFNFIDSQTRLWSFKEDAKDGDFLYINHSSYDHEWYMIFRELKDDLIYDYAAKANLFHYEDSGLWGSFYESLNIRPMTYEEVKDFNKYLLEVVRCVWDKSSKSLIFNIPKFRTGEWVSSNSESNIFKITGHTTEDYFAESITGETKLIPFSELDKEYHLWTIEEAKDGDILYANTSNQIFLFKGIGNENRITKDTIEYYCRVCKEDFMVNTCFSGYMGNVTTANITPASREQRGKFYIKFFEYLEKYPEKLKNIFK